MTTPVSIVQAAARPIAVVRVTMVLSEWPRQFMHHLDKVYAAKKAGHVRQSGQNVMVYFPRADGRVDIECGFETAGSFEPAGEVFYSQTPVGRAASATHVGPYDRLYSSHRAVTNWARENGHRLSGVCWEIYGDWDQDPAKLRTEIFQLLQG
jgi:effector-binding domain-containing protein